MYNSSTTGTVFSWPNLIMASNKQINLSSFPYAMHSKDESILSVFIFLISFFNSQRFTSDHTTLFKSLTVKTSP